MVFPLISEEAYDALLEKNAYYFEELRRIVLESGTGLEGNCFFMHMYAGAPDRRLKTKQMNLYSAAAVADSVLEIGFNAGHSCFLFLLANPNSKIVCFDLGEHAYVKPCAYYLDRLFPGRLTLILGDSRSTVPKYRLQHADWDLTKESGVEHFNLVHVDGGHEEAVANADFWNTYPMLKKGGTLIWDDTHDPLLNDLCEKYMHDELIKEQRHIYPTYMYPHRMFMKV